jgi:uncharacterized membrane protein
MSWLFFAFGAQILFALTVWLDKLLLDKYVSEYKVPVLLLYSSAFSLLVIPILLLSDLHIFIFSPLSILALLFSGILSIVCIGSYLYALENEDASTVVPFFQFIPLFGMIGGAIFLGEILTLGQYSAIAIITLGALVLTYDGDGKKHRFKFLLFFLMIFTAFIASFSDVIFKWGASEEYFIPSLFWMHSGMLLTVPFIFFWNKMEYGKAFFRSIKEKGVKVLSINLTNEGLNALGNASMTFTLLLAPIAIVQTTDAYAPIITLIGGFLFARYLPHIFEEDFSKKEVIKKVLGVGVVVLGSLFLYI